MASETSESSRDDECMNEYMIYRHENISLLDILSLLIFRRHLINYKFVESSSSVAGRLEGVPTDWITALTFVLQKILSETRTPLKWIGRVIEFLLNLVSLNGGVRGLIWNIITDALCGVLQLLEQIWLMQMTRHNLTEFLQDKATQAFIFCNKPQEADLIVLAFRGTEAFNAHDWSTDVDLSWLSMGKLGNVHLGFLKALGLQDETDYQKGFPKELSWNDPGKQVAYYVLRDTLRTLLKKHNKAKILVTGHSLGGALAAIFPALLAMHEEYDILDSIYGVMTYGQPRVGDATFKKYMESILSNRYYRMVYRYDIVPRIPFDMPPVALFKHCGTCIYYDGWYERQAMNDDSPNPNYFDIEYTSSVYLNALGDLIKALLLGRTQGKDFKEEFFSILFRASWLILPGVASHSPRDYVNGGRLAKITGKDSLSSGLFHQK
ncbi:triacylglycerol lipase OBL1 isoform X2 [Elaeis guineensis]|uniref:triacylglycerol lipase OBL1 isoform X2 n=1 Tax=Elaeis guineensis var. tenera TaxID=51953 RepID=UPI003C6D4E74